MQSEYILIGSECYEKIMQQLESSKLLTKIGTVSKKSFILLVSLFTIVISCIPYIIIDKIFTVD